MVLTKVEWLGGIGGGDIRDLDFGKGKVRLSLEGQEGSATDGVPVTQINVVV